MAVTCPVSRALRGLTAGPRTRPSKNPRMIVRDCDRARRGGCARLWRRRPEEAIRVRGRALPVARRVGDAERERLRAGPRRAAGCRPERQSAHPLRSRSVEGVLPGAGRHGHRRQLVAPVRPPVRARQHRSCGRAVASEAGTFRVVILPVRSRWIRVRVQQTVGALRRERRQDSDGMATSESRPAATCRARSRFTTRPPAGSNAETILGGSRRSRIACRHADRSQVQMETSRFSRAPLLLGQRFVAAILTFAAIIGGCLAGAGTPRSPSPILRTTKNRTSRRPRIPIWMS